MIQVILGNQSKYDTGLKKNLRFRNSIFNRRGLAEMYERKRGATKDFRYGIFSILVFVIVFTSSFCPESRLHHFHHVRTSMQDPSFVPTYSVY